MTKGPVPETPASKMHDFTVRWDGELPEPSLRMVEDITGVLANRNCTASGVIYYMYRDLARSGTDRRWLETNGLRYDITVIPPADLCGEPVKTKGHYHPANPAGRHYPEVYEVLDGEAHYLIQTRDCSDAVMIAAGKGDVVFIPPGYGHVTINPSRKKILQMANIVSSRFASEYGPYEELHGAAFFELSTGEFVRNPAYRRHPDLRRIPARQLQAAPGSLAGPLYELVRRRDGRLAMLNHPERFGELFERV